MTNVEDVKARFHIGDEVVYGNRAGGRVPMGERGIVIGFRSHDSYCIAVSFPGKAGEFCNLNEYYDGSDCELHTELAGNHSSLWCKPDSLIVETIDGSDMDWDKLEDLFA